MILNIDSYSKLQILISLYDPSIENYLFFEKVNNKFKIKKYKNIKKASLTISINLKLVFYNLNDDFITLWEISNLGKVKIVFNEELVVKWFLNSKKYRETNVKYRDCFFNKSFSVLNSQINGIYIFSSKIGEVLEIKNSEISNIEIINSKSSEGVLIFKNIKNIKNIKIWDEISHYNKKITNFNEIKLERMETNSDKTSLIRLANIECNKLIYSESLSPPRTIFSNSIFKSIELIETDLWDSLFNSIIVQSLYIDWVNLNNCVINDIDFNDNYKLMSELSTWKKLSYKKLRDNYRQLKHVMDKNWNIIEANKFYEKEMNCELLIHDSQSDFNNWYDLFKIFSIDFWLEEKRSFSKKLPLVFSRNLNDFWNNWIPGFIFLNLFVFFSTLIVSLYHKIISIPWDISNNDSYYSQLDFFYWLFIFWLSFYLISLIIRILNYITSKVPTLSFLMIFFWWYFLYDNDILWIFVRLLANPFYGFKDFINNADNMPAIELVWFTSYKILYWIILWHIWVALKRTTKR